MQWLPYLIFIFTWQIQAGSIPCNIAKEVYGKHLDRVAKDPIKIIDYREHFDEITKDCGVSLKDFGRKKSYFDELEIVGHRINFSRLRTEILTTDPLSNVDWQLKEMEESAKKGKMAIVDFKEINRLKIIVKKRAKEKRDSDSKGFIDSCTNNPINLSNLLPPTRDQDSIGWCYAFVAADLVSAKLKKNISPFDIGLGYESEAFQNSYSKPIKTGDGGFISLAISSGYQAGFCEEQNIAPPPEEIINEIGPTLRMFERVYKKFEFSEVSACELHQSFKKFTKNLKVQDFQDILKESTFSAALESLRSRSCPIRTKLENEFKIESIYYPNPNFNSMYVIQNHLKKKPTSWNLCRFKKYSKGN